MRIKLQVASWLLGGFAWIPAAHAADRVPEAAPRAPTVAGQQHSGLAPALTVPRWYGWETLATDGAALLVAVTALRADDDSRSVLALSSVALYGLGGPIVHLTRDNGWQALGSLLLRGGLPVAGGAAGVALERCDNSDEEDFCGLSGAILGGLAGVVSAMVIDSAVLGWERAPTQGGDGPRLGVASDGKSTLLTAGGRF